MNSYLRASRWAWRAWRFLPHDFLLGLCLNLKIPLENLTVTRRLKMHTMEHLISGIVRADNLDKRNGMWLKSQHLPRSTRFVTFISHHCPIYLIQWGLDVIAVRAIVEIPQEKPHWRNDKRLRQLNEDRSATELMASIARVPVVVLVIAIEQRVSTSTHSFENERIVLDWRHIIVRNFYLKQLFRLFIYFIYWFVNFTN